MKKEKPHYVNNKQFSQAVVDYVTTVTEAREARKEEPIIPNYIGECFLKIAEGLSHKPNFIGYSYREEMVMDGVENCIKAIMNYDVNKATRTGLPNAFAYFTQIVYFAFLRRIAKEKKQQDIKIAYMERAGIEQFADFDEFVGGESIIEKIRHKNEMIHARDEEIKAFGKQLKKEKVAKKKISGPIELTY